VIHQANEKGILFVAAAGNDTQNNDFAVSLPANYPDVLSVAASDNTGSLAFFSNFGRQKVHVVAPGHMILSTIPGSLFGSGYEFMSGTSMACPQVVGIAALVLGAHPELRGHPNELKQRIMDSTDITASFLSKVASGGYVNAANAVKGTFPKGHLKPTDDHWSDTIVTRFESGHPYSNQTATEYTIKQPGAKWIRVKFGRYAIENGTDNVELYDKDGNLFDVLTGFGIEATSGAIAGDEVKLVLRSDKDVTGWGFEVLGYQYQE